jgi:imidazolonepropionase-like amidohydrolase
MTLLVLEEATILDVSTGEMRANSTVIIEGERIAEIADGKVKLDTECERISLGHRVLMPGLIDAHVHATISTSMNLEMAAMRPPSKVALEAAAVLGEMLQRGFTTVRDAAGADHVLGDAILSGLISGPRLFYSGRAITQTGGHADIRGRSLDSTCLPWDGFARVADGVDAVRAAVREELRLGAHQIKIMVSGGVASPSDPLHSLQYSDEEILTAVDEANRWGAYAFAHAYTPESIARAVKAGVRSIEHGNLLDRETAMLMSAQETFLVPTLITYEALNSMGTQMGLSDASREKLNYVLGKGLEAVEIAKSAGVRIGFGTDLLGPAHLQQSQEFALRAEIEAPFETIQSATLVNAALLQQSDELGTLNPGFFADCIAVDGDPTQNIELLLGQGAHIPLVVSRGEIVKHYEI